VDLKRGAAHERIAALAIDEFLAHEDWSTTRSCSRRRGGQHLLAERPQSRKTAGGQPFAVACRDVYYKW